MKIGMLTTHYAINYGAVLQAYSLQIELRELSGVARVDFLNYVDNGPRHGRSHSYSKSSVKNVILSIAKFANPNYRRNFKLKIKKFDEFILDNCEISSSCNDDTLLQMCNNYDAIVVGSDQVWNPDIFPITLYGLKSIAESYEGVVISYAASTGRALSDSEAMELGRLIKEFSAVSLREPHNVNALIGASGKNIEVVPDPVLLRDSRWWESVVRQVPPPFSKGYILVYEVNSPPDFKMRLKAAQRDRPKLRTVVINNSAIPKHVNVDHHSALGPLEFLWAIYNADIVISSSFHCLAFALIFKKPIIVDCAPGTELRQRQLIESLGVDSFAELAQPISDERWLQIHRKMDQIRVAGKKFLKSALGL